MSDHWTVTIETWPHSTGQGQSVDQEACGERSTVYHINAEDAEDALYKAQLIAKGVKSNPRVWQAKIFGLNREKP